jgi:hypothetical protein
MLQKLMNMESSLTNIIDGKSNKKGFEPKQCFMNHMNCVGFSVSYENTNLFREEEHDGNNPETVPIGDLETVVRKNEAYRKHGMVVNK